MICTGLSKKSVNECISSFECPFWPSSSQDKEEAYFTAQISKPGQYLNQDSLRDLGWAMSADSDEVAGTKGWLLLTEAIHTE